MKKITHLIIYSLLLVLAGCEKDTEPKNFAPRLTTGEATDIYRKGATLSGSIEKAEGIIVKEYGFLYSTLQSMAEYTEVKVSADGENDFKAKLQNLEAGKTYYYCSYAYGGYSTARGEVKSFSTVNSSKPVFTDLVIADTDEKSFTVSTSVLDDGGSELFISGFCWKEVDEEGDEPTEKDHVANVNSTDDFRVRINDLTPGRKYMVRAYAINGNGRGYGNSEFVTTKTTSLPAVSSCTPVDSTAVSVTLSARVLAEGTSEILEKGFCYSSETKLPTVTNMKRVVADGGKEIYALIDGLKAETTYYIRAYALNGQGEGYGDVYEFTTLPSDHVPAVAGVMVGNLTTTTAEVTSSVADNGGTEVIEKGFCYATGGETADVGDLVRTIIVDSTVTCRMKRSDVIDNANIRPGDVIVGLASYGQATYEKEYNGGMGSNGLTSARHDVFGKYLAEKYPESYDAAVPEELVYSGKLKLIDSVEDSPIDAGKLVLSPTRTYAPVVKKLLDALRPEIHGMVHCSGGAQTKVLHFVENVRVVKDNLFPVPPLFKTIQEQSGTDWAEMYKVFNMGHRLEVYLSPEHAEEVIAISESFGIPAQIVGRVEACEQTELIIKSEFGEFRY